MSSLYPWVLSTLLFLWRAWASFLPSFGHLSSELNVIKYKMSWDFPGGPVVRTPSFQLQGAWVRSLVRELDPTCHN